MSTFQNAEPGNLHQLTKDPLVLELRELQAQLRTATRSLDSMNHRLDLLEQGIKYGFDNVARQLDVYKDVQLLRERMLRLELQERSPKPTA